MMERWRWNMNINYDINHKKEVCILETVLYVRLFSIYLIDTKMCTIVVKDCVILWFWNLWFNGKVWGWLKIYFKISIDIYTNQILSKKLSFENAILELKISECIFYVGKQIWKIFLKIKKKIWKSLQNLPGKLYKSLEKMEDKIFLVP